MASPALDDDTEEKPLDPAVERVRRRLVRFVIINFGLLFIALMAVVGALVYKTGTTSERSTEQAAFIEGEIALPAGARIVSHSLSGDRLMLQVELAGGERAFLLYDLADGRLSGRFTVVEER